MAVEVNASNAAELYTGQQQVTPRRREEEPVEQQAATRQEAEAGPAVVTEISARALQASREAAATQPAPETTEATAVEPSEETALPPANQEPQPQGLEAARRSKVDVIV